MCIILGDVFGSLIGQETLSELVYLHEETFRDYLCTVEVNDGWWKYYCCVCVYLFYLVGIYFSRRIINLAKKELIFALILYVCKVVVGKIAKATFSILYQYLTFLLP